jgi:hypothetical protein
MRTKLAQRQDLREALEMMRDSLRETLSDARQIEHDTIEEEVLMRAANIDRTCNSALRYVKKAERLLRTNGPPTRAAR